MTVYILILLILQLCVLTNTLNTFNSCTIYPLYTCMYKVDDEAHTFGKDEIFGAIYKPYEDTVPISGSLATLWISSPLIAEPF